MRKTAENSVVTFNTDILAGKTEMIFGDEDEIDRPRGMDGWILNCTIGGAGVIRTKESDFVCTQRDLLLFPSGIPHDYGRSPEAAEWINLWVYFFPRTSWGGLLNWQDIGSGVLHAHITDVSIWHTIVARLEALITLSKSTHHHRSDLSMNALEEVLLWCNESRTVDAQGIDDRILRSIMFMQKNYQKAISVDLLAKECNLSPSRFAHLFAVQLKQTPMRYLERLRTRLAQELLLGTCLAVSEIAYRCGFADALYFSHVFKRVTGKAPRDFRRTRKT